LKYDYIGAPWLVNEHSFSSGGSDAEFLVWNGGFSLRSKKLLELLRNDKEIPAPMDRPEDTFICVDHREYLESKGVQFAPVELAKQFSLEANEKDGVDWTDQFGFHGLTNIQNIV